MIQSNFPSRFEESPLLKTFKTSTKRSFSLSVVVFLSVLVFIAINVVHYNDQEEPLPGLLSVNIHSGSKPNETSQIPTIVKDKDDSHKEDPPKEDSPKENPPKDDNSKGSKGSTETKDKTPTKETKPSEPVKKTDTNKGKSTKPSTPQTTGVRDIATVGCHNRAQLYKDKLQTIYGPSGFMEFGGVTLGVNPSSKHLCRLNITKYCFSNYIADSIDLVVAFSPLYAYHQDTQTILYELHDYFTSMLLSLGIRTQVTEAIMPSRNQAYMKTRPNHEPWEVQITVEDNFYYRENLLNVGAKKSLDLFEYIIWIDAHQYFENVYWWEEAIYHMEHENAVHFGNRVNYWDYQNKTVWLSLYTITYFYSTTSVVRGTGFFAGNGWGMRKEMYVDLGHIIDECVAGACDYSLVMSLMENNDSWDGISIFPHYWQQLRPIVEEHRKKLKGKYKVLRGSMNHIEHPHLFNYFGIQDSFKACCIDVNTDMKRDENFTLHSTNAAFKNHFIV